MTKVFDSLNERQIKSLRGNRIFTLVMGIIVAFFLIFFILFSTVFYFVSVEGDSMLNTLHSGDGVVVNRYTDVERGDVVVIKKSTIKKQQVVLADGKYDLSKLAYPCQQVIKVSNGYKDFSWTIEEGVLHVNNPEHATYLEYKSTYSIIKRVIALEGDSVRITKGKVFVKYSGQAEYTELKEDYIKEQNSTFASTGMPSEWTLGKNQVFYLGDNRRNSEDSTEEGCCELSAVQGVVSEFFIKTKGFTTWLFNFLG